MAINLQNIQVNILDAETKQLIQQDFTVSLYPLPEHSEYVTYRSIRSGSDTLVNIPVSASFVNFFFPYRDEFESCGYDPDSIDGNLVYFEFDEEKEISKMPWVVNITFRKKIE